MGFQDAEVCFPDPENWVWVFQILRIGNHRFGLKRSKVIYWTSWNEMGKCEVTSFLLCWCSPWKSMMLLVSNLRPYWPLYPPRLWTSSSPPQVIPFPDGVVGGNVTQDLKRKILKRELPIRGQQTLFKHFLCNYRLTEKLQE